MKRWAFLTVLLYALTLLLLTVPAALCYGLQWRWDQADSLIWRIDLIEALSVFGEWSYWLYVGVMVLGQALLLLVPLGSVDEDFSPRRPLLVPVITTGFFLGNLCLAGVAAVAFGFFGDAAALPFMWMSEASESLLAHWPALEKALAQFGIARTEEWFGTFAVIGTMVLLWMIWGWIFFRYARTDNPDALIKRCVRWLLRGSILDLLVAVPSHIIVRGRTDCCAPAGTFWGIATGLCIMLMAFGPGVLFLFRERIRRSRPKTSRARTEP